MVDKWPHQAHLPKQTKILTRCCARVSSPSSWILSAFWLCLYGQVAFLKTHKVGGSTMAYMLQRFAERNNLRATPKMVRAKELFRPFCRLWLVSELLLASTKWLFFFRQLFDDYYDHRKISLQAKYDFHYYHLEQPAFRSVPVSTSVAFFRAIIEKPRIFSIVRDPLSHVISQLCFSRGLTKMDQLHEVIRERNWEESPLARELGMLTLDHFESFVSTWLDEFDFICLTETFDECIVYLKRRFNWSIEDVVYQPVWDSHSEELLTKKSDTLMESPPVTSLPLALQAILTARTTLDAALHALIKDRFEAQVAALGPSFKEEVADFKRLNAAYMKLLKATNSIGGWH
eukprot:m.497805 g.497805  ORF g.497805 m.497805 type:complete len:345 (-) comp57315_c0_seq17:145-1179(-)